MYMIFEFDDPRFGSPKFHNPHQEKVFGAPKSFILTDFKLSKMYPVVSCQHAGFECPETSCFFVQNLIWWQLRSKFWPSPSLAYQHRADMVQILPQPISNPPNSGISCSRCSKMFQRESFAYDHQPPYPTRAWNISRKVFQMFQNAYQIDTSSGSNPQKPIQISGPAHL